MVFAAAFLVLVAVIISLIFYNAAFQTFLAKKYLHHLSNELNTTISVAEVDVSFFSEVTLKQLYIEDLQGDTLVYINKATINLGLFSWENKMVNISNIKLVKPYFNLHHPKDSVHNNLYFITNYFAPKEKSDTSSSPWQVNFESASIYQAQFTYNNDKIEALDYGVDYNHVDLTYLSLNLYDIQFIENGISTAIENMRFFEKSGFQVDELTTHFTISDTGIVANQLTLKTPNTAINGDVLFGTDSFANLSEFITEVQIQAHFDSSLVSFRDICFFTETLDCLNKSLVLNGDVKGTLDHLKGRNLDILIDDGTTLIGNVDISGIPNAEDIFIYLNVKELKTTKEKLEQIPLYPFVNESYLSLPDNFKHFGEINFRGKVSGFLNDFVAYGSFTTNLGVVSTDLALKMKNDKTSYSGKISSRRFNLGKFFEISDQVGNIALNTSIKGSGFSLEDIDATLTGKINQVEIKGYNYKDISVNGNFKNQIFEGKLDVKDENIAFTFDGNVDFSGELPHLQFFSEIKEAKLAKLNFIETREKMNTRFSTMLTIDLIGNNLDNIIGEIEMLNSLYIDKLDTIFIPNSKLKSYLVNDIKKLELDADFAQVNISGNYQFKDFTAVINNLLYTYIPSKTGKRFKQQEINNNFTFNATILHTEILTKLFFNDIKFGENTKFWGEYNSTDKNLLLHASADSLKAYGNKIKQLRLKSTADINQLKTDLQIGSLLLLGMDSLQMENFVLSSTLANDSLLSDIKWLNNKNITKRKTDGVISNLTFFNTHGIYSSFDTAIVFINDLPWELSDSNQIAIDSTFTVNNFEFANNNQKIVINGGIEANNSSKKLNIYFQRFNLGLFEALIPDNVGKTEGVFNGVASFHQLNDELIFTSDLNIKDFKINDYLVGNGDIKSAWDYQKSALAIDAKFFNQHIPSIEITGNYFPGKTIEENLDFNVAFHKIELNVLQTYLAEYVTGTEGLASANIKITGNTAAPQLKGKIRLTEVKTKINYLQTTYSMPSFVVNVYPDMITIDNALFLDEKKNPARGNATLLHNNFKNISFDLGMSLQNFMVLNTGRNDNPDYYGTAYASGMLDLNYDQFSSKTGIEANLTTEKNTIFNIPLEGNEEIEESNYITFVTKIDSAELNKITKEEVDLSKFSMLFNLTVSDNAEVRLIFDEKIGDIMRSRGNGDLRLEINSAGDFTIFGDYEVASGDYLFTLQNVINKRFSLLEGGTIQWNGDPLDAYLNISASYRTRARLYDLLLAMDTSDVLKKRIPVDVVLNMKNSMLSPDIHFDIVLPTADEDTKSKVKSVLYVSSQEENIQELNRQVFALLVLNRFLSPPGVDGVAGNAGLEKTATSELLSNQLSNMLSKISNDFDIGVNYRPGDEIEPQELELALSTQILNDRLIIDSNFGLADRQNSTTGNNQTNNLIGDVVLEYKVSKDGKLRVKAFNKSNQYSLLEINSPYTQGVGISYKEEFDNIGEFFKSFWNLFKSKTSKK